MIDVVVAQEQLVEQREERQEERHEEKHEALQQVQPGVLAFEHKTEMFEENYEDCVWKLEDVCQIEVQVEYLAAVDQELAYNEMAEG